MDEKVVSFDEDSVAQVASSSVLSVGTKHRLSPGQISKQAMQEEQERETGTQLYKAGTQEGMAGERVLMRRWERGERETGDDARNSFSDSSSPQMSSSLSSPAFE